MGYQGNNNPPPPLTEEQVSEVYKDLLKRNVDPSGVSSYVNNPDITSTEELEEIIKNSPEYKKKKKGGGGGGGGGRPRASGGTPASNNAAPEVNLASSNGGTAGSTGDTSTTLGFTVPDVSQERFSQQYGVQGFQGQQTAAMDEQINQDVQKLREFGQELMTGNLPADVSEAVRKATAAGSLARGILPQSQMARNLTARDLGKTSYEMMGAGASVLSETAKLQQQRVQYRNQYELASAELRDAMRRTDITQAQLAEEKHQFRNKMVLALNEQITGLGQFREELQFKYAATALKGKAEKAEGPLSTIDNLISQLEGTLKL